MDLLNMMNGALNYIEENLTHDIDPKEAARIALCSEYHFKRMFSFLAGIPPSEYIRRRRLTLAAFELNNSDIKIIDIAIKYGYSSPDSFTRAFQSLHGVTPSEAKSNGQPLKAYPRMTLKDWSPRWKCPEMMNSFLIDVGFEKPLSYIVSRL